MNPMGLAHFMLLYQSGNEKTVIDFVLSRSLYERKFISLNNSIGTKNKGGSIVATLLQVELKAENLCCIRSVLL